MVKIMQTSGGHLITRTPAGVETLNTAKPMPDVGGVRSFTGVQVFFNNPPGTSLQSNSSFSEFRYVWPRTSQQVQAIVLGPLNASPVPHWWTMLARATQDLFPTQSMGTSGKGVRPVFASGAGEWVAWWGGSLLLELFTDDDDPLWGIRHLDVAISGGNWVLNARHSNEAYTAPFSSQPYQIASRYYFDIELKWGYFK